jgi:hypothetical protein
LRPLYSGGNVLPISDGGTKEKGRDQLRPQGASPAAMMPWKVRTEYRNATTGKKEKGSAEALPHRCHTVPITPGASMQKENAALCLRNGVQPGPTTWTLILDALGSVSG